VAAVLAALAGLVGRVLSPGLLFSGETTAVGAHSRSNRRPGLDGRQVFGRFLAPELRAISTSQDVIDGGFDSLVQSFEDMATAKSARFDALAKDGAQVREMLDIDRWLTQWESKQSALAQ
jgi:hypothetical protein